MEPTNPNMPGADQPVVPPVQTPVDPNVPVDETPAVPPAPEPQAPGAGEPAPTPEQPVSNPNPGHLHKEEIIMVEHQQLSNLVLDYNLKLN